MNKKQVGALLKVMSKDTSRPILRTGYVDNYNGKTVLVATDGYQLAAVYMEGAEDLEGKLIRREAIERWYKLATAKSTLTGAELKHVSADDFALHDSYESGVYPPWQQLVPSLTRESAGRVAFNADYMKNMQDINGGIGLEWHFGQQLEPILAKNEHGIYLVMPMKG